MKTYIITWTDGNFEKTWEAETYYEAVRIINDPVYFPLEIKDYSKMSATISHDGIVINIINKF